MLLAAIILSFLINYARPECKIDNSTPYSKYQIKLQKDLYKCMRVPRTENLKDVKLIVYLQNFYFEDKEELFSIKTLLQVKWQEPRLQWKPEDNDGINIVEMSSNRFFIWTPLELLYYKEDYRDLYQTYFYPIDCSVNNHGRVICSVPRALLENATGWNIIYYDMIENLTANTNTSIVVVVERQVIAMAVMIVSPSIILAVLIMNVMVLDVKTKDRRLQWKPEDYGGITSTQISSAIFWTPMMIIFHKEDYYNTDEVYYPQKCKITNDGKSTCRVPTTYTVTCKTTLENWPFDSHICAFKIGTADFVEEDMVVKSELNVWRNDESTGWRIIYYDMVENITKNTNTSMLFVVERQATSIAVMIIPPSIILTILIMTSMYLDVRSNSHLTNKMFLLTITFITLINYVSSDCIIDEISPNKEYMDKLFDLLNSTQEPCKNETIVTLKFNVRNFYFDKSETMFNIFSWIIFTWEDPRLRWNPDNYDGIDSFQVPSYFMWSPMPILHHMREFNEWEDLNYEARHCVVKNTGRIVCVPHAIYTTNCHSQLKNWPYDIQTCTIKFHIRDGIKDNVTFTFNSRRGLSALGVEYGSGWNIIDFDAVENATGDVKISLTFVVERQALGIVPSIVIPSITVVVLTLLAVILDIENRNRLGLAIFSLFINIYLLKVIGEIIPHQGHDSPSILYFINFSLYITVCTIGFICVSNILINKQNSPKIWIINFNDYVINNYIVTKVFKWQPMSQTSLEDIDRWVIFTKIINLSFFFIAFTLYLIMFLIYMPQPTPAAY
ncbi:unnamed protein product [Euphydryas editha]|uniref:Neurotransmitter-gated ion-channel ligand-binding domain-containing protein n=1 Tax=Euphydryas editha TaxID=104508 RepID=A0AAU9UMM1_EUPED|nr:unnamed protein product [Euphydryas editha]